MTYLTRHVPAKHLIRSYTATDYIVVKGYEQRQTPSVSLRSTEHNILDSVNSVG